MATLQAVQYSMNGEPLQKQKLGKDYSGLVTYPVNEKTGEAVYPTGKEWYIFKLANSNKQGGVRLSNIDDVLNPKTKRVERIRILSGVDSVWLKDQKDLPREYERTNWMELRFYRGNKVLRVSKNNPTLLEYMRLSNNNIGNPFRIVEKGSRHQFFEYDSSMAEKEQFEREEFELDMALLAKGAKPQEMRKHAAFLGIRLVNDMGEPKSDDGMRREYVIYAKRNPEYFGKTIKNTLLIEVSWMVRKGIADGFIEIGREPQKAFWAQGGGYIGTYPQGENVHEYLTNLAMTNSEEGIQFKENLKKVLT